jgi:hypothetical protein
MFTMRSLVSGLSYTLHYPQFVKAALSGYRLRFLGGCAGRKAYNIFDKPTNQKVGIMVVKEG